MDYFWLQKVPNNVKLCFSTKTFFFSKLWTFLSSKPILGWKVNFSKNAAQNYWHGSKMLKKILFFFKAWEKRVNYVLFTNHTLCDLKVCRSSRNICFEAIAQFLTILWSTLGGGGTLYFCPPFFLNLDFTRNVVKRQLLEQLLYLFLIDGLHILH